VKSDFSALKWIYGESRRIIPAIILLSIFGILLSSLSVSFALVSKNVIDAAVGSLSNNVVTESIKLAILIAAQLVLQVLVSTLDIRIVGRFAMSMRKKLFGNLLMKDYTSVNNYHSGELINRLNSDISFVSGAVVEIIPNVLGFLVRIVLSFVALFSLDMTFALICLAIGPVVLMASYIYRRRMKGLQKKCQESDGKTRSFMQECLQNILVIKSFGNEKAVVNHSTELQNENYRYNIKRNNVSIAANILFYIAATIVFYFALAWGAYRILTGVITFGTLTAMLQLVGQIQIPFRSLSSIVPRYFSMIVSAERIMEILDLPDEEDSSCSELDCERIYRDAEEIVFNNVSFAYDNTGVLDQTDLIIKKGDFIAVGGSSGIGKSTFLKLLLGIISPTSGEIYIKLKNGERIALGRRTRGIFAYVPQGNMILSGTIRDNISFSDKALDDEYIVECAKTAEIWEFIDSLPDKLDTVLGEKGLGLSEGQIQRIAVARALYHDAPIILLDEATSALDEKTEAALLANIKNTRDKTCIIVSHRKAAFEICNKSVLINDCKFKLSAL